MQPLLELLSRPLSRGVRFVLLPALFLVLLLFFVYLRFPYDRVLAAMERSLSGVAGAPVRIGELAPAPRLLGPGFELRRIRVERGRAPIEVERLHLRPAWSLSWLTGTPALYVDLESAFGRVEGAVVMGGATQGFDGDVAGLDLANPLIAGSLPIEGLAGRVDAEADLAVSEGIADGDLEVVVSEGSVAVPGTPLGIPFDSIQGTFRFGGDRAIEVERLEVAGPMLDGAAVGGVGRGPAPLAQLGSAPLDLNVRVHVKASMAQDAVRRAGVRLGRDGKAEFVVSGTLSDPRVR